MPLVEGESLRDRLAREKQLPIEDALWIAREVADALEYAHAHGLVHRDIKPGNILLENGHAVVADFGIARAVSAAGAEALTETGLRLGTPLYMSPEQCAGESMDGRSDQYALGCVLYEMLAGEPPFTGRTAHAILARRMMEPVPSLLLVRESIPIHVQQVIDRALSKAPADRFATARQFAEGLAEPGALVTRAPGPRQPHRRWSWIAAAL
jgi:serine/threonine-protein kinase